MIGAGRPSSAGAPLVIAIDGPSAAGKSTIARMLADRLSLPYIDTGAMYRAVALIALRDGLRTPLDESSAVRVPRLIAEHDIDVSVGRTGTVITIDGEEVEADLRTPECSSMASAVSALPAVRERLVRLQRELGRRRGGVIEGRDIGSVVFPEASLKVFLTAVAEERAERRHRELTSRGDGSSLEDVADQQRRRDRQDVTRSDSPLQVARGSVVVDTTGMTLEEVVARLLEEFERARSNALDSNGRNTVRSQNDAS